MRAWRFLCQNMTVSRQEKMTMKVIALNMPAFYPVPGTVGRRDGVKEFPVPLKW
jgi:hypothetical protein